MPNFTDIQNAILAALQNAKVYIDAKDDAVKAYADSKIDALMNTSDLTAKLALLAELNTILDGDAATVGFQAWQTQVTKLTGIVAEFEAFKASNIESVDAVNANIETLTTSIDSVKTSLEKAIADAVAGLGSSATTTNTAIVDTFVSMQAKAATLFAV